MLNHTISGLNVCTSDGVLQQASVVIKNGIIVDISSAISKKESFAFPSNYHLIPGLIDLHVHGINGSDVMDASCDALRTISRALARQGTTAFLATTMTASEQEIENALLAIRTYVSKQGGELGATLLGVHLEGPFISPNKAGAQCKKHILLPDVTTFKRWQTLSDNLIKLVTLAPELQQADELITYLKQHNIIASIGHSDASFDETMFAIEKGCQYVTHLFNAMRGIHQREPGVVTASLIEKVWTELIVDGVHLHPAIVKLIFKIKDKEKLILVTDAMRATCLLNGVYDLGGQEVTVQDHIATLPDGTLAGSVLQMPKAIKNMMQFTQCDLLDALKMASENPAKALGVFDRKGSIAVGKDADLVVLDSNLNVVMTLCSGRVVYDAASYIKCSIV